jgi:23S rRNA (cytosine1962-C5)-methyltransferase
VIFDDDHLLAVNKPAGMNTHAPGPFSGEGLYEWLRHREPRWANLAIVHRLDKETSGLLLFTKGALANKSLTLQFTQRRVKKRYVLLTDRAIPRPVLRIKSVLTRAGDRYVSKPSGRVEDEAETRFAVNPELLALRPNHEVLTNVSIKRTITGLDAFPLTGRTHQIRVHAAENGFPILGDVLYGGSPASRVFLHALEMTFIHPGSGEEMTLAALVDFKADHRMSLRTQLMEDDLTDSYRLVHGASDGFPGWYVDRLGDYLLAQGERVPGVQQIKVLRNLMNTHGSRGAYHKTFSRQMSKSTLQNVSPCLVLGQAASERFVVRENQVRFELSLSEGYSVGLFLDQRDNRRRLLSQYVAADFRLTPTESPSLLNTFAYTCGFSVAAALAGYQTTSIDLSRKYLDWGKRNFTLNHLDPAAHEFIYGDVIDWLRLLAKKGKSFDVIVLDPPTFSRSKRSGIFQVERDYGKLVQAALPLLRRGGVLFASTNAAGWPPDQFIGSVEEPIRRAKRKVLAKHYVPQPPDFPVSRTEPAYLKTTWLKIE